MFDVFYIDPWDPGLSLVVFCSLFLDLSIFEHEFNTHSVYIMET
jgi:hypothetical protein